LEWFKLIGFIVGVLYLLTMIIVFAFLGLLQTLIKRHEQKLVNNQKLNPSQNAPLPHNE
jgi:hypothetical protein